MAMSAGRRWTAAGLGLIPLGALLFVPLPWPDALLATRIVNRIDIAAPPERVFAYVTAPVNWPRWHPQSRAVSGAIERTPQPGEKTIEDFEIAGRRGRATWTSALRRRERACRNPSGGCRFFWPAENPA